MNSHIKEEQQIGITKYNKKIIFWILICLTLLLSSLIMGNKAWRHVETLASRNAAYSLMPLVTLAELGAEDGGHYGGSYTTAQKSYAEMFQLYVDHTKNRDTPFLLKLLPFSQKNIVKCLEKVAEELKKESSSEEESREKIERAAVSIAQFFSESGLLTNEPVITLEPEVMSQEIRDKIGNALKEAHEKAEIFAHNSNIANSEEACMSNRRAIVYLYLARFGYDDFIAEEKLKQFRADTNRTIYYNRLLRQHDVIKAEYDNAIKAGKRVDRTNYAMLEKRSDSEVRRLRLLQAIIDNDIQEARDLSQIAIMEAMPEISFSDKIPK